MAQPNFLPRPFAESGFKNTIPDNNDGTQGLASFVQGFPDITQLPIAQGGIAPKRGDFNDILFLLSRHLCYMQNGGVWSYAATQEYEPPALVYDPSDDLIYLCVGANGPSGTVIAPHNDNTGTYWIAWQITEINWINEPIPTRVADNQIRVTGDQSDTFLQGRLLRFNQSDNYMCRVLGSPSVSGGNTTLTLWFDNATYVVPSSITSFQRSRLSPVATARGVELITENTYTDAELETLLKSYCYSAISWEED